MAQRESYLTKFTWTPAAIIDSVLFAIEVNPMAETPIPGGIIPSSLSFVSRPFEAWSGSLIYRVQLIASNFHRGRLGVFYDPHGYSFQSPYTLNYLQIFDIQDNRDFSIEVKWQKGRAYCRINNTDPTHTYWTATPGAFTGSDADNGFLCFVVVNELVVPDSVTPVDVMISVKAGDDFELVNPASSGIANIMMNPQPVAGNSNLSFHDLFSVETQACAAEMTPISENEPESQESVELIPGTSTFSQQKALLYYGEKVTSIRQLLKRYTHYGLFVNNAGGATTFRLSSFYLTQMPVTGGFDPDATTTTGAGQNYWYLNQSFITYFKNYFAVWKGSTRYKLLNYVPSSSLAAVRLTGDTSRVLAFTHTAGGGPVAATADTMALYRASAAGMALTSTRTMDSLEIEIPYTLPCKYSRCNRNFSLGSTNIIQWGYPGGDKVRVSLIAAPGFNSEVGLVDCFVAAGDDFSFFGVVGAPVLYYSSSIPAQ
jgi:hypothetical protein